MTPPNLSKSRFVAGKQCHLRLWNECFERQLATPVDAATQALFDSGHAVGELATTRHPGGVDIHEDYRDFNGAEKHTVEAMAQGAPALFEAAFEHQGIRVRVDILVRVSDDTWDMVEVKSSTKAKPPHVEDLAIQVWVAQGAGLRIRRAGVLTLDTRHVHPGGAWNVDKLFQLHDQTEGVMARQGSFAAEASELHGMLAQPEAPQIAPGPQCSSPYPCKFYEHCSRDLVKPQHPLKLLPGFAKKRLVELESEGVVELRDLPPKTGLSTLQRRVLDATLSDVPFAGAELAVALAQISHPVHHLDFETFAPALPPYAGTRSYQPVPFQWSNHIQHEDGTVEHQEFLAADDTDPREALVVSLLKTLGERGSICIYSDYEKTVVRKLAELFPAHRSALLALVPRMWDLLKVVRDHYYHPQFRGSFSIKAVLPALVPSMSYEDLAIHDGREAAALYEHLLRATDSAERTRLRAGLLEYCGQDTLALVELRKALAAECGG